MQKSQLFLKYKTGIVLDTIKKDTHMSQTNLYAIMYISAIRFCFFYKIEKQFPMIIY